MKLKGCKLGSGKCIGCSPQIFSVMFCYDLINLSSTKSQIHILMQLNPQSSLNSSQQTYDRETGFHSARFSIMLELIEECNLTPLQLYPCQINLHYQFYYNENYLHFHLHMNWGIHNKPVISKCCHFCSIM